MNGVFGFEVEPVFYQKLIFLLFFDYFNMLMLKINLKK
jgi:hypothetical protein